MSAPASSKRPPGGCHGELYYIVVRSVDVPLQVRTVPIWIQQIAGFDSFKLVAGMRLLQSALPNGDIEEWEFSTELSSRLAVSELLEILATVTEIVRMMI